VASEELHWLDSETVAQRRGRAGRNTNKIEWSYSVLCAWLTHFLTYCILDSILLVMANGRAELPVIFIKQ
jgi:hypothetical protein